MLMALLERPFSAIGAGLLIAVAASGTASAEDGDLDKCKDGLQKCSGLLGVVQHQRDAALTARAQCESSLSKAKLELELLKRDHKPGLTHRKALELLELSMQVLEKTPESEVGPTELLLATRKLRTVQEKATDLSVKLTERAVKLNGRAVAAPP
jgi:hypothetical protein